MLDYDRIDVSEGIDVDKRSKWKGRNICYYWYFLKVLNFNQMSATDAMIY